MSEISSGRHFLYCEMVILKMLKFSPTYFSICKDIRIICNAFGTYMYSMNKHGSLYFIMSHQSLVFSRLVYAENMFY